MATHDHQRRRPEPPARPAGSHVRNHVLRPLIPLLAGVGLTGAAVAGLLAERALGANTPPGSPPTTGDTTVSDTPEAATATPSNASPSATAPTAAEDAPANAQEGDRAPGGESNPPAIVLAHTQKITIGRRANCHSTARRRTHKRASHKRSSHTRASHKRSCAKKAGPDRHAATLKQKHAKQGSDRRSPGSHESRGSHGSPGNSHGSPAASRSSHTHHHSPHAHASLPHALAPAPQFVAGRINSLHLGHVSASFSAAPMRALDFYRIPLFLLPIYRAAAARYDVPWELLAAINEVETDYGNDLAVSPAGAIGWMQFLPAAWARYGVDALAAGYSDPYNPIDAVFAAARYLSAAGVSRDLHGAIFAYDHSDEYVESVLLRSKLISLYPHTVLATLTHLAEGRMPLAGHVTWGPPGSGLAPWSPTRDRPLPWSPSSSGPLSELPAAPFPSAPAHGRAPAPSAAAKPKAGAGARIRRGSRARLRAPRLFDLMGAPHTAVVAVQSGRIVRMGRSAEHGRYLVLRDVHGNRFTYAGLGTIIRRHVRSGARVRRGEVLGRVRVPPGAKRGHLLLAIRPAGDPRRIDPRPVVMSWLELSAAAHPPGAKDGSDPLGLGVSVARGAHRADATAARARKSTASSTKSAARGERMSAARWYELIEVAGATAPRLMRSAPAGGHAPARK